jgi:guanyl-specific ribonuclease Sa
MRKPTARKPVTPPSHEGRSRGALARVGGGVVLAALLAGATLFGQRGTVEAPGPTSGSPAAAPSRAARPDGLPAFLPPEARATIGLIARGGPFPHRQDGAVFGNRELLLPSKPRGYYHEYTVATPGLAHRGARRIVTGGIPPEAWYYTDDHYDSFRRFEVPR